MKRPDLLHREYNAILEICKNIPADATYAETSKFFKREGSKVWPKSDAGIFQCIYWIENSPDKDQIPWYHEWFGFKIHDYIEDAIAQDTNNSFESIDDIAKAIDKKIYDEGIDYDLQWGQIRHIINSIFSQTEMRTLTDRLSQNQDTNTKIKAKPIKASAINPSSRISETWIEETNRGRERPTGKRETGGKAVHKRSPDLWKPPENDET